MARGSLGIFQDLLDAAAAQEQLESQQEEAAQNPARSRGGEKRTAEQAFEGDDEPVAKAARVKVSDVAMPEYSQKELQRRRQQQAQQEEAASSADANYDNDTLQAIINSFEDVKKRFDLLERRILQTKIDKENKATSRQDELNPSTDSEKKFLENKLILARRRVSDLKSKLADVSMRYNLTEKEVNDMETRLAQAEKRVQQFPYPSEESGQLDQENTQTKQQTAQKQQQQQQQQQLELLSNLVAQQQMQIQAMQHSQRQIMTMLLMQQQMPRQHFPFTLPQNAGLSINQSLEQLLQQQRIEEGLRQLTQPRVTAFVVPTAPASVQVPTAPASVQVPAFPAQFFQAPVAPIQAQDQAAPVQAAAEPIAFAATRFASSSSGRNLGSGA